MPKIKTPLLRPMRTQGATMYTFPSAAEDIALNINNSNQGVAMSHYALLNLNNNNFEFTNPTELVFSLQNDLMNNECVIVNRPTYNFQEPQTVSEYVFWKWISDHSKGQFSPRALKKNAGIYRENNFAFRDEDRIIQCFGSVDAGNYLSTEFGMFNETYVSVPTSYGNGPVFLRSVADNVNYKKGQVYETGETIEGRANASRLYLNAKEIGKTNPLAPDTKKYTDPYAFEIVKDIPTIQAACQEVISPSVILSSLDDVNIDSANQFYQNADYAISADPCEFKFNTILLYYSLYDLSDVKKEAIATNLFAVIFLDGINKNNLYDSYSIAPVIKKKSYSGINSDASYFGSGYSFRVNVKTMSVYDNTDATIEDNSTVTSAYSQDFNDVLSNLNKAVDIMNTNMRTTSAIQDAYMSMRAELVDYQQKITELIKNLDNDLDNRVSKQIELLKQEIDFKFEQIKQELEISDFTADTPTDGTATVGLRTISAPAIKRLAERMQVNDSESEQIYGAALSDSVAQSTNYIDRKVDIISGTSTNINAAKDINLTGTDVKVHFKSGDKISTVSVSDIISRLNGAEKEISQINSIQSLTFDNLIALGIIPVVGILQPRAKKPEAVGLYLKTNTSGQIQNYVLFDGEDYKETVKCEPGKLYSVQGVIYVFDGETCKPIGS